MLVKWSSPNHIPIKYTGPIKKTSHLRSIHLSVNYSIDLRFQVIRINSIQFNPPTHSTYQPVELGEHVCFCHLSCHLTPHPHKLTKISIIYTIISPNMIITKLMFQSMPWMCCHCTNHPNQCMLLLFIIVTQCNYSLRMYYDFIL